MSAHSNPKCKTCKYRAQKQAVYGCNYLEINNRSRNCSVAECDKYEKGKRIENREYWETTMIYGRRTVKL